MTDTKQQPDNGFALVETVLILIIIGIIAGVGYWVVTQRKNNNTTTASTTAATTSGNVTAQAGTLSAIDQLTALDSQSETSIANNNDSADQATVLTANSAASNIGGAYNEANF